MTDSEVASRKDADKNVDDKLSAGLERVTAAVLAAARVEPGDQVIDLGCRTGQISLPLAERGARVLAVDASHGFEFFQMEGLMVDEGTTMAHLRGLLDAFAPAYFGADKRTRFRPGHYPFTEPSLEVDIQCKRGKDEIRFGEGEDWLEILGCGMVHPNVLKNCGLDPDEYQGFAWGMGIDRIAMLKYGMHDLRAFFEADVRWLNHYGFRPLDFPTLAGGLSA